MDDVESKWTYAAAAFDFVHIRSLAHAVHSMPQLLAHAHRTLAPGG